jgi:hypothetical protein
VRHSNKGAGIKALTVPIGPLQEFVTACLDCKLLNAHGRVEGLEVVIRKGLACSEEVLTQGALLIEAAEKEAEELVRSILIEEDPAEEAGPMLVPAEVKCRTRVVRICRILNESMKDYRHKSILEGEGIERWRSLARLIEDFHTQAPCILRWIEKTHGAMLRNKLFLR